MRKSTGNLSRGEKSLVKSIDAGFWIMIVIAALVVAIH